MVQVGAGQAELARVVHPYQIAGAGALGACPVSDRLDDCQSLGSFMLRHQM
jgi:hypothetical protein